MNKKKILIFGLILLLLCVSGSFAYGVWISNSSINSIKTSDIKISYNENSDGIIINDTTGISDEEGIKTNSFDFSISSSTNAGIDLSYYVIISLDKSNTIDKRYVKLYFIGTDANNNDYIIKGPISLDKLIPVNKNTLEYDSDSNDLLLYTDSFDTTKPLNFKIKMYLSNEYTNSNEVTNGEINIESQTFNSSVDVIGVNGKPKEISN